jgi:hypothetical protein
VKKRMAQIKQWDGLGMGTSKEVVVKGEGEVEMNMIEIFQMPA